MVRFNYSKTLFAILALAQFVAVPVSAVSSGNVTIGTMPDCQSKEMAAFSCTAGLGNVCEQCIRNVFNFHKNSPCAKYETEIISGISAAKCDCVACESQLISYYECRRPECGALEPDPSGFICFSGATMVNVKGKGNVLMEDLKVGDAIAQVNDGYSQVYSFGHKHQTTKTSYLQVLTASMHQKEPLEISPEHLIYMRNADTATKKLVPAADLKIGDFLVAQDGSSSEILSLKTVVRIGAYAPLTTSGSLIVNGVEASTYVSRDWITWNFISGETLAYFQHAGLLPVRAYCFTVGGCEQELHNEKTGFSTWVQFWYKVEQWQQNAGIGVQIAFWSVLAVPAALLVLLGKLLMTMTSSSAIFPYFVVVLMGYYWVWNEKIVAKKHKACSL